MNKSSDIRLDWPVLGNEHVISFLGRTLGSGRAAGSYIFVGPDDLGKTTVANYFAASLLCQNREAGGQLPCGVCPSCRQHRPAAKLTGRDDDFTSIHSDYHAVKRDRDKKNISIEQVRELIGALGMSSFLNSYKVGIIRRADSLSEEAANALLKTLEEPRDKVVVILTATDLDRLPATIVSRSQVLRFYPVKTDVVYKHLIDQYGASRSQAKNLARLSLGRPALAVKFLEDRDFLAAYAERTESLLAFWRTDLNGRFAAIADLLGKLTGQEAVALSRRVLETWQGLARDLLLLQTGQKDLVQHEIVIAELEAVSRALSLPALLSLFRAFRQADAYLSANVSPRAALESVALAM